MVMSPAMDFPDWLENYHIADEAGATAYDQTTPDCRAALKTGIAIAFSQFRGPAGATAESRELTEAGLRTQIRERPADWSLVIFDSSYNAAARLCGAALLPIIANVPRIAAISVNGLPTPPVLVALELCGLCDIFSLDSQKTAELIAHTARSGLAGGIIMLHNGTLAGLAAQARRLGISLHEEYRKPRLLLSSPQSFNLDILKFCHGFVPDRAASGMADAIFAAQADSARASQSRLLLTPGCEGYWTFPHMSPGFFRVSQSAFSLL